MRRPFFQLILKEAKQALGTALVFTGVLVALLAYFLSRIGIWPVELLLVITLSLLGFVPFWALWRTYYSLRQEWTGHHMYLLLALPIPGWYITASKLIVALVEMLIYVSLIIGTVLFVFTTGGSKTDEFTWLLTEPAFIRTIVHMSLLLLTGLLVGMIVVQFAHLASRLVSRFRGLMMIGLVVLSTWAVLRIGGFIAPAFDWLPQVPMHSIEIENDMVSMSTAYVGVTPLIGSLIVSLVLFWFGSYLLERDIEL